MKRTKISGHTLVGTSKKGSVAPFENTYWANRETTSCALRMNLWFILGLTKRGPDDGYHNVAATHAARSNGDAPVEGAAGGE